MIFSLQRVDNTPNITKAVEWDDHQSGLDVDLEQLPQNLVEVEIGGIGSPFLLRLIHQKRNTIPTTINVNIRLSVKHKFKNTKYFNCPGW